MLMKLSSKWSFFLLSDAPYSDCCIVPNLQPIQAHLLHAVSIPILCPGGTSSIILSFSVSDFHNSYTFIFLM